MWTNPWPKVPTAWLKDQGSDRSTLNLIKLSLFSHLSVFLSSCCIMFVGPKGLLVCFSLRQLKLFFFLLLSFEETFL